MSLLIQTAGEELHASNSGLEPYSNHGHSYRATILAYAITGCGIACSVAPILMNSMPELKSQMIHITQCITGIMTGLLSLIAIMFIWKHKSVTLEGSLVLPNSHHSYTNLNSSPLDQVDPNHNTQHRRGHLSSFQIVLFGAGSVVYCIIHLTRKTVDHSLNTGQFMKFGGLIICCILCTLFLRKYNGISIKSSGLLQYSLAVMIGGLALGWISITISALWGLSVDNSTISAWNVTTMVFDNDQQVPEFTAELGIEMIECLLEPFFVEFLTISTGCVLQLWNTMTENGKQHQLMYEAGTIQSTTQNERAPLQDYGAILQAENPSLTAQRIQDKKFMSQKFQTCITVSVSVLAGVVYVIVAEMLHDMGPFTKMLYPHGISTNFQTLIPWAVLFLIYSPCFVIIYINFKLQNNIHGIPKRKPLGSSDYLLLLCSAVLYVYYTLKLIAVVAGFFVQSQLKVTTAVLSLFFWFYVLVQIWLQTEFILTIHYVSRSCPSLLKSCKFLKFTLIYFIAMNVSFWFELSITQSWRENAPEFFNKFPEFVACFGELNTALIFILTGPIHSFYCFHCAIIAYEILQTCKH